MTDTSTSSSNLQKTNSEPMKLSQLSKSSKSSSIQSKERKSDSQSTISTDSSPSSSSAHITTSSSNTNSNERQSRRMKSRRSRQRSNSLTTSVKQQFDELISTFESLIDGQIPLKSQASKLKSKVDDERKKLISLIKKRQNLFQQKFKSKTLKFRVNVQKSLRTAITGNPNRSIRRHIQEPPQIKFIDKMSFTLSVLTLILSELFLLSYPEFFKYYYAAMLIPLMIARYIDYKDKKYHFFMFDFCYFINFVSISHIFFFPNSTWLFETLFALANGPVLFAIMVWRNSMVLHSVDKMTSLFIHAFPPFYTYCYRWLDTSRVKIISPKWLYLEFFDDKYHIQRFVYHQQNYHWQHGYFIQP